MGKRRNVYKVLVGEPEGKDHLEDQGVDGRMGSKWTSGRLAGRGVEWIHLAQDRDRWRAVVNAVMNLRVLVPRSWKKKDIKQMKSTLKLYCSLFFTLKITHLL
jgi:hypothetical protein